MENPRRAGIIRVLNVRACGSLLWLVVATCAFAQNQPRLGYVYPAGGRQGTSFEVRIGGQYLNGTMNASVSGDGVKVALVEYTRPLTQRQVNDLREELRKLQQQKNSATNVRRNAEPNADSESSEPATWSAADEQRMIDIRKRIADFTRTQANPAIAENVVARVTIAPEAQCGKREIRLRTGTGLSNPLIFCVGDLPEFTEHEEKVTLDLRFALDRRPNSQLRPAPAEQELSITLPAMVNGQIMPGDADRYRFKARKGERIVVSAKARYLIPYLADAVPGWFQATLALYDANGAEVEYVDDFRFNPDPILFAEIPRDGEYVVEIRDAIYRGREDFVYRIAMGELPVVTSVFPLGREIVGLTEGDVEISGWNLPENSAGSDGASRNWMVLDRQIGNLNGMNSGSNGLAEVVESEPNNERAYAQVLSPSVIVNGRISDRADRDLFRFDGRAGDEIVFEVVARRLGSPLDSILRITDGSGRQLAANDDFEDKGFGLMTHHADSRVAVTLPSDGVYFVHLADAQGKGGAEYSYRLRISPPQPDFDLRVAPSSINGAAGSIVPITVYALRRDGFDDEIELILDNDRFTLSGGRIAPGADHVRCTVTMPPAPYVDPIRLKLQGRATIGGNEIVRPVTPADDMTQAFAYHHLVPTEELKVCVSRRGNSQRPVRIVGETPVQIPMGGTARIEVAAPGRSVTGEVQFVLDGPPDGIVLESGSTSTNHAELIVRADASKVKPGLQGNLIVTAYTVPVARPGTPGRPGAQRRVPLGWLPAIPFEIVE